jgi:hypothetical protein
MLTYETYNIDRAQLRQLCDEITAQKQPIYTQENADVLYNFNLNALLTHTTPGQQLSTYLLKHIVSIVELLTNPNVKDTEAITRFADAMNYISLAYSMWRADTTHHAVAITVESSTQEPSHVAENEVQA